jgi:hypothetical protein
VWRYSSPLDLVKSMVTVLPRAGASGHSGRKAMSVFLLVFFFFLFGGPWARPCLLPVRPVSCEGGCTYSSCGGRSRCASER